MYGQNLFQSVGKKEKIHFRKKGRADDGMRKRVDMAQQGIKRETDLIESVQGILCSQESWFCFGQILLTIPLFSTHHHSNGRYFTFLLISYCLLSGHFLCFNSNNLGTANILQSKSQVLWTKTTLSISVVAQAFWKAGKA